MPHPEDAIYEDLADLAGSLKKIDRTLELIWAQTRKTPLRDKLDALKALSSLDLLSARKEVEGLLAERQAGNVIPAALRPAAIFGALTTMNAARQSAAE